LAGRQITVRKPAPYLYLHRIWSLSEQAHVPAEQPTPRQDAWVPATHAHQGRARRPRRTAPQGPRAGQCL